MQQHTQPTTIAILGCDTVVGRTLSLLLEGHGYKTTLLDSYPTGVVDELLEGAHLLILTPRVDGCTRGFPGRHGQEHTAKGRYTGDRTLHGYRAEDASAGGSHERAVAVRDEGPCGPHRSRPSRCAGGI